MKTNQEQRYPEAANLEAGSSFPYFVRRAQNRVFSAGDVGFGVLHWHEDLQFIYCQEGTAFVKTLEEERLLTAGEGAFLNSGVIHYSVSRSNPCRYMLFRFPARFLSFYLGSPAEPLTRAITENPGISLVPLSASEDWGGAACQLLQRLAELEEERETDPLYPYDVLTTLAQLWQIMLRNVQVPQQQPESVTGVRMRAFLEYIEAHYAEEVTLEDLAASAGVSKSEALRCFRQTLQTTPYKYVMEYRLSRAADLLDTTDLPAGEIADRTGFHQQSYFGKCFKEKTGMTPGKYRRRER